MSNLLREDLGNQVVLSNDVASIVIHRDMLKKINLKKIFKPMQQVQVNEKLIDSILYDMDTTRKDLFAEVNELPPYEEHVCSMVEERPTLERSFIDLLISGAILR